MDLGVLGRVLDPHWSPAVGARLFPGLLGRRVPISGRYVE
jgi:hypothetical protein